MSPLCRNALRELVRQKESGADKWPDEALLSVVTILINRGAELVEDTNDVDCTLTYARHRFAVTTNAGGDLGPCSRLLALLLSTASENSTGKQQEQGSHGRPRMQQQQQYWGDIPTSDVRTVMQHVLRTCSKEQQRAIAATHPDCATALLATACGSGPSMRDVVHLALSFKANVNGIVLPKPQRKRAAKQAALGAQKSRDAASNGNTCCECDREGPCSCPNSADAGDGTAILAYAGNAGSKQGTDKARLASADNAGCQQNGCAANGVSEEEEEDSGPDPAPCTYTFSPLVEAAAAGDKYLVELLVEVREGGTVHASPRVSWAWLRRTQPPPASSLSACCSMFRSTPCLLCALPVLPQVHGADPAAHQGMAETVARNVGQVQVANILFQKTVARRAARAASRAASTSGGSAPEVNETEVNETATEPNPAINTGASVGMGLNMTAMQTSQYVTFGDWLASVMPRWRLPRLPSWPSRSARRSAHNARQLSTSRKEVEAGASTSGARSRTALLIGAGLVAGGGVVVGLYLARHRATAAAGGRQG